METRKYIISIPISIRKESGESFKGGEPVQERWILTSTFDVVVEAVTAAEAAAILAKTFQTLVKDGSTVS